MSRDRRLLAALLCALFLALLLPRWLPPDRQADPAALGAGFLALALLAHCARAFAAGELFLLSMLALPGLVAAGQSLGALPLGAALALALKCLLSLQSGYFLCALSGLLLPARARLPAQLAVSVGAAALFALVLGGAGWTVAAAPALLCPALYHYLRRLRERGRA